MFVYDICICILRGKNDILYAVSVPVEIIYYTCAVVHVSPLTA